MKYLQTIPISDSKKDKLGFNDFCNTLAQLAGRIYPSDSDNDSFIKLFNANISNLFSNETARIKLMVKESSVIELLKLLKKSLKVYMRSYMNKQNLINYESFIKFCREFEIFPRLCTMVILKSIFYLIANEQPISSSSKPSKVEEEKIYSKKSIDENSMMEALAICAFKSPMFENDKNPVEKILHLSE